MSHRFFSETPITGEQARLEGDEARHVAAAMRAKVGDELTLFDGSGAEFLMRIARLTKHAVELEVVERREIDREAACRVTLAVALPKGERQRWLVEKAVELGVARLMPLDTERGVAEASEGAVARMHRWVIEASKQCGRNRLMEIAPASFNELLGANPNSLHLLAHPSGASLDDLALAWAAEPAAASRPILIAIGPEGGFTDAEVTSALAAGFQAVGLGPRILRVETAAIALAARWLLS